MKPELFRHEALFELERATGLPVRVTFIGLFTACDREGRFKWAPKQLKLDILPWDDVEVEDVLGALAKGGFVQKYEHAGKPYGCIPTWNNHQLINGRESRSRLPAHPDACATRDDASPDGSDATQGELEGKGTGRGKGKGTGREGKGNGEGTGNHEFEIREAQARLERRRVASGLTADGKVGDWAAPGVTA